ncbi:MAG: 5-oxoprolinase subunit PxpB [Treponema sp.]|nr:5-oxoprolinase subunit PxpB [Treponema sp.]
MTESKIVTASEDSLQIQFEQKICQEVNGQISDFVEAFESFTKDMPEIREVVATYCAVTVYFNPEKCSVSVIREIAQNVLDKLNGASIKDSVPGRIINIPVCYEDQEFAPDLQNVCTNTGFNREEVINLHSSKDYLIYMLGFLPGFPYLGGMDERLETPRLENPRTRIPAGSVAIGGKQTGLYPVESPGGWQIIGRTPLKVFDLKRNPAFLYKAGDRIRFVPVSRQEFDSFDEKKWLETKVTDSSDSKVTEENSPAQDVSRRRLPKYVCTSGVKILDAGLCTTIQDEGIIGYQKFGIGQSGAMDIESFHFANRLCGNDENSACLETTLKGTDLCFTLPCDFAITGAEFKNAFLDGKPVPMNTCIHAEKNSVLSCGFASKGLRSYIAFAGGILVPEIFGSRSTNLKSRMGGFWGRKLQKGDELAVGWKKQTAEYEPALKIMNSFFTQNNEILTIQCLKSSQFDFFSKESVEVFEDSVYTVNAQSDRMGIRFEGRSLNCGKTDIISDAIPFGAVQITSAGLPVVMAADRQTTGGYAKIACVTKDGMCRLAQAVPGTKVKFEII